MKENTPQACCILYHTFLWKRIIETVTTHGAHLLYIERAPNPQQSIQSN